ncbi:MAG: histidine kinase [Pseudomonadota bacterium]
MYSTRTKLVFALAWLLFWTMMAAVEIQDYLRNGHRQLWQPLLWTGSSALVASSLLYAQRHFTRRFDRLLATPLAWFSRQVLCLPLHWIAFVPLTFGIRHGAYALAGQSYSHEPWTQVFVYEAIKLSPFFLMYVVIVFGVLSYHELQAQMLRAEQSNGLLRQAQLQRLTQQMQPHFLFNALNTVSSLMYSDLARADATLIRLAEVLRATLDASEQLEAPLATELHIVRGYAQVMAERFAERVEIDWQIADDTLACMVPIMSLQPLLENVFKHTVEQRRQSTRIVLRARRANGKLCIDLSDDVGTLAPGAKPGIGLGNLRQRLAALYGERASLSLSQLAPAGVLATLELPCAC